MINIKTVSSDHFFLQVNKTSGVSLIFWADLTSGKHGKKSKNANNDKALLTIGHWGQLQYGVEWTL